MKSSRRINSKIVKRLEMQPKLLVKLQKVKMFFANHNKSRWEALRSQVGKILSPKSAPDGSRRRLTMKMKGRTPKT